MKRKIIRWLGLGIVVGIVVMLALFIHGAKMMRRLESAQAGVERLATWVELYKDNNGKYPASMKDLESGETKIAVAEIVHNPFNTEYTYEPLKNGFHIGVRTEKSLFYARWVGSKTFQPGEATDAKHVYAPWHLVPE
jgi:hypothetical protein